ncbi:uncharacterized protein LOC141953268 [Strix uralensis]|uniref:uncharacterized protein LOC141953268 n=1 Tax=Strix uralensis TaxID=36305 RepID=UPI003DA6DDB9
MRRGRGAGLAGLAAVLLVAAGRAQVQQEPSAETNEGTGVTINCSHPNIQTREFIQWYRQLPGRGPAFLVSSFQGSRELQAPPGRLSVAADRRSSALWLARPRRGDAAVYYCALGDTGRGAGAAAGHEPPRAGPGGAGGGGGTSHPMESGVQAPQREEKQMSRSQKCHLQTKRLISCNERDVDKIFVKQRVVLDVLLPQRGHVSDSGWDVYSICCSQRHFP